MTKPTYKIRFTLATQYIELEGGEEMFKNVLSALEDKESFISMFTIDDKLWIINKSKIELIEQLIP